MSKFADALGQKYVENQSAIRTREFEMGGHTFKVRVPTVGEYEAIFEKMKNPNEEAVKKEYDELTIEFVKRKDEFQKEQGIEYKDNDIIIQGRSLLETAKNKVLTESRITEFFKLIVPENKDFDMNTITYADIEEDFPFTIQLELMDKIASVISPDYNATKGK